MSQYPKNSDDGLACALLVGVAIIAVCIHITLRSCSSDYRSWSDAKSQQWHQERVEREAKAKAAAEAPEQIKQLQERIRQLEAQNPPPLEQKEAR